MAKILILQHAQETPACTTLEWCQSRNIEPTIQKVWLNQNWPTDLHDFLGVIVCGGGMNVDQEHLYPWLSKEKSFIKNLLEQKTKTLGLCLGAQLMAEILGARVGRHTHWEVGWHTISLQPHILFPNSPAELPAFQWHRYTFETPSVATKLGSSPGCANQAFIFEKHGLAFQFHPESDKAWIKECVATPSESYPKGEFVQNREEILENIHLQEPLQQWYWKVLDAFFLSGPKGS